MIPRGSFTDGRPAAVGIEKRAGTRHVPTLVNRVYGRVFFLDGRAVSLDPKTGSDIWVLTGPSGTPGDAKAAQYLGTQFNESQARFSSDGHFVRSLLSLLFWLAAL